MKKRIYWIINTIAFLAIMVLINFSTICYGGLRIYGNVEHELSENSEEEIIKNHENDDVFNQVYKLYQQDIIEDKEELNTLDLDESVRKERENFNNWLEKNIIYNTLEDTYTDAFIDSIPAKILIPDAIALAIYIAAVVVIIKKEKENKKETTSTKKKTTRKTK